MIDDFLNDCLRGSPFLLSEVKTKKNELLKKINKINLNPGAENFIEYLSTVNHVVVTNTSQDVVEHFKLICPQLQMLTNWITREDYISPKPDPEPYMTAINKYKKLDQYIIGIENTYAGYLSLWHVTKCIYIVNNLNDPRFSDSDVYLINNFDSVFK
jgi:beta-phosphoglucomutase-like phosphatase (HAD superfamily)